MSRAALLRAAVVLAAALSCLAPAAARAASVSLVPAAGPAGTAATLRGEGLAPGRAATIVAAGRTTRVVVGPTGAFELRLVIARRARGWSPVRTRIGRTRLDNRFRVGAPADAGETVAPGGARLRWSSIGHGTVRLDAAGLGRLRAVAIALAGRPVAALRSTAAGRVSTTFSAPPGATGVLRSGRTRLPFTVTTAPGGERPIAAPGAPATSATAPGVVAPPGDVQPTFPIRAAFYYPWFPEAWSQGGMTPYTHYTPTLGWYSSGDTATIARQLDMMRYGHIQVGISSWWGQGHYTDQRLPQLLSTTRALNSPVRWAVYYEPEGWGDPSVAQLTSDLAYLRERYGSDPAYLRVNGRFVVFAYGDANDGCATADRWGAANAAIGAYIVLKVFPGYQSCASQPDGWHQYAPANREQSQPGHSFSVSPGFWLAGDASPRLARDPTCFGRAVRDMVASHDPWQLVTTFDEWGEGTSVEPAQQWATASGYGAYLDALHDDGAGAAAGAPC